MRGILLAIAAVLLAAPTAQAQPKAPRTADGRPDLSGVWTNASLTGLNRPPGVAKLAVSRAEAEAIARSAPMARFGQADAAPVDVSRPPPATGDPVGYNTFWMDWGNSLAQVRGEYRTSWIVEPANGQIPYTETARARVQEVARGRAGPSWDGPEALEPADRCLIATRGSGGPGMLNNIYNSNYQFLLTRDALVIVVEMIHDARIVPIARDRASAEALRRPAPLKPWLGDSVGWWEGGTLVVETVSVHPEQGRAGPIFLSDKGRVVERFTRVSDAQVHYEFAVEDPLYYSQPWRAEMSLNARPGLVYEYACHEGNYALPGILAGARRLESQGR